MTDVFYLEDLAVGQKFDSAVKLVDEDEITGFAKAFDPQPFHLDHKAAARSVFGRLAASGWHTGAMTMRLLVDSPLRLAGGIIGTGFDEFRWLRPVYPGDALHLEAEVMEIKPSRSRPEQGLIKVRITTFNQSMEPVQILLANLVVPCRPGG
jgi:acyl dehydratase